MTFPSVDGYLDFWRAHPSDLREDVVERALRRLRQPAIFLRAPRGLADAAPLYSEDTVTGWRRDLPALIARTVPDVNHFTITLSEPGAVAVAAAIAELRSLAR